MSQELSVAQNHAWNLARTVMTPVILFKVDEGAYGVLPAEDLDDDEVNPSTFTTPTLVASRFIEPAFPPGVPLTSGRPQGKLRRGSGRALAPFALRAGR